jgi:hypothetical protein
MATAMIMALLFLVGGLLIGFVLGTRARQMLAAITAVSAMLKRLPLTLKLVMDKSGDDEIEPEDEDKEEDEGKDELEVFLSHQQGLDLHPELEMNPVILYHIKVAKDRLREERRQEELRLMRQAWIDEGLSEEQADARVELEAGSAGGGAATVSALATLIQHGARTLPASDSQNAENALLQNMRRKKKNVDVYLQRVCGVDTTMQQSDDKSKRIRLEGTFMGPLEKAMETKEKPVGHRELRRIADAGEAARAGRAQMRSIMKKTPGISPPIQRKRKHSRIREDRRQAVELRATQIAAALASLEDEADETDRDNELDGEEGELMDFDLGGDDDEGGLSGEDDDADENELAA